MCLMWMLTAISAAKSKEHTSGIEGSSTERSAFEQTEGSWRSMDGYLTGSLDVASTE